VGVVLQTRQPKHGQSILWCESSQGHGCQTFLILTPLQKGRIIMAQSQAWFYDYNSYRRHSALGYLPKTPIMEKYSVN